MATKRRAAKNRRTHSAPKTVLRLPDLDQAKSAVLNSLSSPDAQRGYRHAIDEFMIGTAPSHDCRSAVRSSCGIGCTSNPGVWLPAR